MRRRSRCGGGEVDCSAHHLPLTQTYVVVWAKLNLANSSTYRELKASSGLSEHDTIAKWSEDFWHALIKNKVRSTCSYPGD